MNLVLKIFKLKTHIITLIYLLLHHKLGTLLGRVPKPCAYNPFRDNIKLLFIVSFRDLFNTD